MRRQATLALAGTSAMFCGALLYVMLTQADVRPVNQQRDYLFAIGVQTQSNENRDPEIFALKRGRPQTGEGSMEAAAGQGYAATDVSLIQFLSLAGVVALLGFSLHLLRRGTRLTPPRLTTAARRTVRWIVTAGRHTSAWMSTPGRRRATTVTLVAHRAPRRTPPLRSATTRTRWQADVPMVFRADVTSGPDVLRIRLAGARSFGSPPYTWVVRGGSPARGFAQVALGELNDGVLYVDLALTPDVVTVTGPPDARQRQAISLVRQLVAVGTPVTVVGEFLGWRLPAGCRRVESLYDLLDQAYSAAPEVVIQPATAGYESALRRILGQSHGRPILVIVGDVGRTRWSIDVHPVRSPANV